MDNKRAIKITASLCVEIANAWTYNDGTRNWTHAVKQIAESNLAMQDVRATCKILKHHTDAAGLLALQKTNIGLSYAYRESMHVARYQGVTRMRVGHRVSNGYLSYGHNPCEGEFEPTPWVSCTLRDMCKSE